MNHANLADLKEIYAQFQKRKDVFPHVRQDKLRGMIEASQVVWQCTHSMLNENHPGFFLGHVSVLHQDVEDFADRVYGPLGVEMPRIASSNMVTSSPNPSRSKTFGLNAAMSSRVITPCLPSFRNRCCHRAATRGL